jgi:hypothetical protein
VNCPGSTNVINTSGNRTLGTYELPYGYSTSIAANVTDVFDSGRGQFGETVSSIWDIQWRSYVTSKNPEIDNGSARVDAHTEHCSLLLEDEFRPVEGLVVDIKDGGIGFRNHTVSVQRDSQTTWSEDLLSIQPESACVDSNLTLDFVLSDTKIRSSPRNIVLTDRGGFTHVTQKYPDTEYTNAQKELDLGFHAWKAATLNNMWTMLYLNVTNPTEDGVRESFEYLNSHEGKEFILPNYTEISARTIRMDILGSFLGQFSNSSYDTWGPDKGYYENPWNITNTELVELGKSSQNLTFFTHRLRRTVQVIHVEILWVVTVSILPTLEFHAA